MSRTVLNLVDDNRYLRATKRENDIASLGLQGVFRVLKRTVDFFDLLKRIVNKKQKIRNNAQLVSNPLRKTIFNCATLLFHQTQNSTCIRKREHRQINFCDLKVGSYTNSGYRNDKVLYVFVVQKKMQNFCKVLLEERVDFLLSICHNGSKIGIYFWLLCYNAIYNYI